MSMKMKRNAARHLTDNGMMVKHHYTDIVTYTHLHTYAGAVIIRNGIPSRPRETTKMNVIP